MRIIMGLDAPDAGGVTVNGRHYHDLPWPLHEVGALLEARSIHPGRSARAHLRMLAETNHIGVLGSMSCSSSWASPRSPTSGRASSA